MKFPCCLLICRTIGNITYNSIYIHNPLCHLTPIWHIQKITEWKFLFTEKKLSHNFLVFVCDVDWQFKSTSCFSDPPSLQKNVFSLCTPAYQLRLQTILTFSLVPDAGEPEVTVSVAEWEWPLVVGRYQHRYSRLLCEQYFPKASQSAMCDKCVWVSEFLGSLSLLACDWPLRRSFRCRCLCGRGDSWEVCLLICFTHASVRGPALCDLQLYTITWRLMQSIWNVIKEFWSKLQPVVFGDIWWSSAEDLCGHTCILEILLPLSTNDLYFFLVTCRTAHIPTDDYYFCDKSKIL